MAKIYASRRYYKVYYSIIPITLHNLQYTHCLYMYISNLDISYRPQMVYSFLSIKFKSNLDSSINSHPNMKVVKLGRYCGAYVAE